MLHFYFYKDKIRVFFYGMSGLAFLYLVKRGAEKKQQALTWLCIMNLLVNTIFIVAPYQICGQQMWKSFCPASDVREMTGKMAEAGAESSAWYRVDRKGDTLAESIIQGYQGCENYYSLMNGAIWSFYDAMMISPGICGATHHLSGLDGCLVLESLLGVRYFEQGDQIETNEYSLPLGVEYTETVGENAFFALEPLDRRDIMTQKMILPDTDGAKVPAKNSCFVELPCKVRYHDFERAEGVFIPGDQAEIWVDIEGELPDSQQGELYLYFDHFYTLNTDESQVVTIGDKRLYVYAPGNKYAVEAGQKNALVKMDDVKRSYVIQIPQEEKVEPLYGLDDVRAYWYPTGEVKKALEKRKEHSLQNLQWSNDRIEGDIQAVDGYLFLSIPYSDAWKVYVDGRQMPVSRANIGFMAVGMEEGDHHVQIVYEPLPQKVGAVATLSGILMAAGLLLWDKRRRRLRESSHSDILV